MNILIVPADAVITDITNEAAALVDPDAQIDLVSNLYFGIGCTLFLTVVIALVTTRIIEPRLGHVGPQPRRRGGARARGGARRSTPRWRPRACAGPGSRCSACSP